MTQNLTGLMLNAGFRSVYMTHVGKVYQDPVAIYGVSPNFIETSFSEQFLKIEGRFKNNSGLDIV